MFENYFYYPKYLLFVDEDSEDGAGGEDSIDDSSSIDKAVKGAEQVVNETLDLEDENTEESTEEEIEESNDEDEEEEVEDEEELTEEQKLHAKSLFKLLSNPQTSLNTLKTLVSQAGLEMKEPESKKEETALKKSIKNTIKDALGTNYPHLADVLGTTLEGLLTDVINERTKDIREKLAATDKTMLVSAIKSGQDVVVSQYVDVPAQLLREFVRMQEAGEISPGPKQTPEQFFRSGLLLASETLGIPLVKRTPDQARNEIKKKNKSPLDVLSNRGRANASSSIKEGVKTTQVKTFNDAIKLGVEAVAAKMKKG